MNKFDKSLYKTHKSVVEMAAEFGLKYNPDEIEITLDFCSSCGIWDKPEALKHDLDEFPICNICLDTYGP